MPSSSFFLRSSATFVSVLSLFSHPTVAAPSYHRSRQAGQIWNLEKDFFAGGNFFNNFNFYAAEDPTHGFVHYVTKAEALSAGAFNADPLVSGGSNGQSARMDVDYTNEYDGSVAYSNVYADGVGRPSVRLESQYKLNVGTLVIADISHMPESVCGSWPAFWALGDDPWPNNGEVDIIEGWNEQSEVFVAAHTNNQCTVPDSSAFSGQVDPQYRDCNTYFPGGQNGAGPDAINYTGCKITAADATASVTFGTGFNSAGGGVYAMKWTEENIAVYFWTRSEIPADITSGQPKPETWTKRPIAIIGGSSCRVNNNFNNMRIIFDTTFCGDAADNEGSWGAAGGCGAKTQSSCSNYVGNNPSAYENSFWDVEGMKVYKLGAPISTTTSSTTTRSSTSSSTTTTTTSKSSSTSSTSSSATVTSTSSVSSSSSTSASSGTSSTTTVSSSSSTSSAQSSSSTSSVLSTTSSEVTSTTSSLSSSTTSDASTTTEHSTSSATESSTSSAESSTTSSSSSSEVTSSTSTSVEATTTSTLSTTGTSSDVTSTSTATVSESSTSSAEPTTTSTADVTSIQTSSSISSTYSASSTEWLQWETSSSVDSTSSTSSSVSSSTLSTPVVTSTITTTTTVKSPIVTSQTSTDAEWQSWQSSPAVTSTTVSKPVDASWTEWASTTTKSGKPGQFYGSSWSKWATTSSKPVIKTTTTESGAWESWSSTISASTTSTVDSTTWTDWNTASSTPAVATSTYSQWQGHETGALPTIIVTVKPSTTTAASETWSAWNSASTPVEAIHETWASWNTAPTPVAPIPTSYASWNGGNAGADATGPKSPVATFTGAAGKTSISISIAFGAIIAAMIL